MTFVPTADITPSAAVFSDSVFYTVNRSLTRSYSSIAHLKIAFSSYTVTSTSSPGFGFDMNITYNTDPMTQVSFTFFNNNYTLYSSLGVNFIIICNGFNSIVNVASFVMPVWNINYTTAIALPALADR
jgi:hypothetical protein